jgi:hypothetical protein
MQQDTRVAAVSLIMLIVNIQLGTRVIFVTVFLIFWVKRARARAVTCGICIDSTVCSQEIEAVHDTRALRSS